MRSFKLKICFLLLFSISFSATNAQSIDSAFVNTASTPHSLHIDLLKRNGARNLLRIDQAYQSDTALVDCYFAYCSGPSFFSHIDTTLIINNQKLPANYNVLLRTYFDTNSVDSNCNFNNAPIPYDSLYLRKEDIFLSLAGAEKENAGFYPNPSNGVLFVNREAGSNDVLLSIYGPNGQLVFTQKLLEEESRIVVPKGLSGVCLVVVESGGEVFTEKVILE